MLLAGSIVYLLTGGLLLSLGWLLAALLCCLTPVTRPLSVYCLRLSRYCLWPANARVLPEQDADDYQAYIRSGKHLSVTARSPSERVIVAVQALLWLPIGVTLIVGHLAHWVVMVLVVTLSTWIKPDATLARWAFFPRGVKFVSLSPPAVSYRAEARPRGARLGLLTAALAVVAFFSIPTSNQAYGPSPFDDAESEEQADAPLPSSLSVGGYWAPWAQDSPPPLLQDVQPPGELSVQSAGCSGSKAEATERLARPKSIYGARPLPSRPVRVLPWLRHANATRRTLNVERMTIEIRNGMLVKVRSTDSCTTVVEHIAHTSPLYQAGTPIDPDNGVGPITVGVPLGPATSKF